MDREADRVGWARVVVAGKALDPARRDDDDETAACSTVMMQKASSSRVRRGRSPSHGTHRAWLRSSRVRGNALARLRVLRRKCKSSERTGASAEEAKAARKVVARAKQRAATAQVASEVASAKDSGWVKKAVGLAEGVTARVAAASVAGRAASGEEGKAAVSG